MTGSAAVEAEYEYVEVGSAVLGAQAMVDDQRPSVEIGEEAAVPEQDEVCAHITDHIGFVADRGGVRIDRGPPSVLAVLPGR